MKQLTKKEKNFIQYVFLLFLIGLTTYLVSTNLDIKLIPKVIKLVNIKYIIFGLLLVLIYIIFEAFIIHIIINVVEKSKIKLIGFKIATMGLYYNLVTPFASGSQPIQIYTLTKYNIDFSKAVAIVTNKTVVFQSIVTMYCGYLVLMNINLLKSEMPSIMVLVMVGVIMNVVILLLGLFVIFSPKKIKYLSSYLLNILTKLKLFKFLENKKGKINNYIDEYNYSIKIFLKDKKFIFLSLVLTILQLSVFFSISYCVYKAFNLKGISYFHILTLQVFLYMAISPIPTPGNVGANELAFLTIFSDVFPKELMGYAVFLYGGFVYYLLIIICGIFTIITHLKEPKIKIKK